MRIAVVGLGGVGGYLAASLSSSSHEIVGFARGAHLEKIQRDGITIIEDEESWSAKIEAKTLEEAEGYFDIAIFCVKSYDLVSSYEKIAPSLNSQSIILSFSNGVSNGDVLRELSCAKVLDACIYILSHLQESGVIRKKGKVFAAVFGGEEEPTHILKNIFDEAHLRNKTPKDIKTALWKKYIFIAAFGTLSSYYDKSIGYVYEHHYNEAKATLEEIASVAKAMGIYIDEEIEKSLTTAKNIPYDSSTSMHLDFQNKRKTELETLSAYIVKSAKKESIKVQQMELMYNKLLYK